MDSKTLDNSTQASHQGFFRVTRAEYARYRASMPWKRAALFLLSFTSPRLHRQPWAGGGVRWQRFREHFHYGDTTPAQVLDARSGLVAAYTDLDTQGLYRFPVINIFIEKLHLARTRLQDGEQVATFSLYWRSPSVSSERWGGFNPIVARCVSADQAACDAARDKIPSAHWQALQVGLQQVPKPWKPGLYHITLPPEITVRF